MLIPIYDFGKKIHIEQSWNIMYNGQFVNGKHYVNGQKQKMIHYQQNHFRKGTELCYNP